jgi:hypothetical protein
MRWSEKINNASWWSQMWRTFSLVVEEIPIWQGSWVPDIVSWNIKIKIIWNRNGT